MSLLVSGLGGLLSFLGWKERERQLNKKGTKGMKKEKVQDLVQLVKASVLGRNSGLEQSGLPPATVGKTIRYSHNAIFGMRRS